MLPRFLTAVASSHADDVYLVSVCVYVCMCLCVSVCVGVCVCNRLNPELMLTWLRFGQVSQMERGHNGALIDSLSLQI